MEARRFLKCQSLINIMLSININDLIGLVKSSYVVQVFYNTVLLNSFLVC